MHLSLDSGVREMSYWDAWQTFDTELRGALKDLHRNATEEFARWYHEDKREPA